MIDKAVIALIFAGVAGSKLFAWWSAVHYDTPWPVIAWFSLALVLAAAGGDTDMP